MIRLVALMCGLLCGAGFLISGLYDPALAHTVGDQQGGPFAFGIAIFAIVFIAAILASMSVARGSPYLGGTEEPLPTWTGRKPLIAALLFGLGWGLAGYFPLSGLVSAGTMSPGAAIFLACVLVGMIGVDVVTGKRSLGGDRQGPIG